MAAKGIRRREMELTRRIGGKFRIFVYHEYRLHCKLSRLILTGSALREPDPILRLVQGDLNGAAFIFFLR